MQRLTPPRPGQARARGFTLVETMVALVIMGVLLSVGIPSMSRWIFSNKAASASQFYAEGFAMARNQALTHNGASRLVLTENAGNRQFNWQVDICFPSPEAPCTAASANWSTATTVAPRDPEGDAGFKSLLRRADALPAASELAPGVDPEGARAVYFTPLGWVNPAFAPYVQRIELTPSARHPDTQASAVVLTLAGIATRCKPGVADSDLQRCPP